jgi:hypothetical protein
MSGANGSGLPLPISAQNISDLGLVQQWLVRHHLLILSNAEGYNSVTLPLAHNALLIILLGCIAFGAPNVYQIMDKWSPALTKVRSTLHRLLLWHPNWRWALLSSVMLFWATLRFDHPARFLYFQF